MMNILVGVIILALLSLAIGKLVRDKKNGKSCGGCSGCAISGNCGKHHSP